MTALNLRNGIVAAVFVLAAFLVVFTNVSNGWASGPMVIDGRGNLYVADVQAGEIVRKYGKESVVVCRGLHGVTALAVDRRNCLYAATKSGAVYRITGSGQLIVLANGLNSPRALHVNRDGGVVIAESDGTLKIVRRP